MQDVTTGPNRKNLIAAYEKLGTVRAKSADFVDLYDEIALPVNATVKRWSRRLAGSLRWERRLRLAIRLKSSPELGALA
jgi:hypothetical protein